MGWDGMGWEGGREGAREGGREVVSERRGLASTIDGLYEVR